MEYAPSQNILGQRQFAFLQFADLLFNGVLANEPVNEDVFLLSHSVDTIGCLLFQCRVPEIKERESTTVRTVNTHTHTSGGQ